VRLDSITVRTRAPASSDPQYHLTHPAAPAHPGPAVCFLPPSTPDDHSPPEPPLPIPNRTVKRQHADDSVDYPCESRSSSGTLKHHAPLHPSGASCFGARQSTATMSTRRSPVALRDSTSGACRRAATPARHGRSRGRPSTRRFARHSWPSPRPCCPCARCRTSARRATP
jgi:hypothetical protein